MREAIWGFYFSGLPENVCCWWLCLGPSAGVVVVVVAATAILLLLVFFTLKFCNWNIKISGVVFLGV